MNDIFKIQQANEESHLVFGWASVSQTADGTLLEDFQGDIIEPEDLEKAAYEYVLKFRDTGELHDPGLRKKGKLVASIVLTKEIQKAIGIPEGTVPVGWFVGFHIDDPDAWARIREGKYLMFSIEGQGMRVPEGDEA